MRYILLFLLFSFNLSAQYTVTCEKCGSEEEQLTRGSFTGIKIQRGTKPAIYLSQPVKARTKGGSIYLLDAHGVKFEAKFNEFTTLTTPAAWRAFMADCVCVSGGGAAGGKFGDEDTTAVAPRFFESTSTFTEVYSSEDPETPVLELEKSNTGFSASVVGGDSSSINITETGIEFNSTGAIDIPGYVVQSTDQADTLRRGNFVIGDVDGVFDGTYIESNTASIDVKNSTSNSLSISPDGINGFGDPNSFYLSTSSFIIGNSGDGYNSEISPGRITITRSGDLTPTSTDVLTKGEINSLLHQSGRVIELIPFGSSSTSITAIGTGAVGTFAAAASALALSGSGSYAQRNARVGFAVSGGTQSGFQLHPSTPGPQFYMGMDYEIVIRFSFPNATNSRLFAGMYVSTNSMSGSVLNYVNCIGIGYETAASNMLLIHNDGSGVCTTTDLGASFPKVTSADATIYRLYLKGGTSSVSYIFTNEATGVSASGTVTTNLPAANQVLLPTVQVHNDGAVPSNVALHHLKAIIR